MLVDLADPAYVPFNSAVRQLVYSDSGRSILTVSVDGNVVLREEIAYASRFIGSRGPVEPESV